jgi:hypothetical protein
MDTTLRPHADAPITSQSPQFFLDPKKTLIYRNVRCLRRPPHVMPDVQATRRMQEFCTAGEKVALATDTSGKIDETG